MPLQVEGVALLVPNRAAGGLDGLGVLAVGPASLRNLDELRGDLQRLTTQALEFIEPWLLNPLSGGWLALAQDELRFDEHGQPSIISRPLPNVSSLIAIAARQLLDSPEMAALVQRVTASGILTQRFLYDQAGTIGHPCQLNTGLLENFLVRYAELAPDLSWQPVTFDHVWHELETYIAGGEAIIEVTSLLHHVRLRGASLVLGDDELLHTLTEADKQAIWGRVRRNGPIYLGPTYLQQPLGWDTVLRTRATWRRGQTSALNRGRERHEDVLAALRLLRPGRAAISVTFAEPAGPGAAFASPGAGLSDLVGWGDPRWGSDLEVAIEDGATLKGFIASYRAHKSEPWLAFAFRRFSLSYERNLPDDQLVDGWIALESLFGDPEEREQVTNRLADDIADCLRDGDQARERLRRKVIAYYGVRSRVVHGNLDVTTEEIAKVAQRTDGLLREALVDRLSSGA